MDLFDLDSKYIASYATKEKLLETIEKIGVTEHRYAIVRTPAGRWTAIFAFSNTQSGPDQGNMFRYKVTKSSSFPLMG